VRILPAFTATIMICTAMGCQDESARQAQQATADFDKALAMFQQAEQGYIPEPDLKGQKLMSVKLAEHRQQRLAAAREALQPVIESGTPLQQSAALRLEAAVFQSAATHQARQAVTHWAELSQTSVNLLNLLLAIDSSDAQVRKYSVDATPLLTSIKNDQTQKQGELTQLQKSAEDLRARINDLDKKRSDAQNASDAATGEARKLRTDAFTRKGDEQYTMYDQATQADRRASLASVQAQTLAEQIGVLRSELGIIESRLKTAQDTLGNLQKSIQRSADRAAAMSKAVDSAENDKKTNIQALNDLLKDSNARYQEQVRAPLTEAAQKGQQALDTMNKAIAKTPASSQREVKLDLLAKHAALAHVLTSHLVVNGDWNQMLQMVATTAAAKRGNDATLMPADQVSFFKTNADEAQSKQRDLQGQARAVIDEGLTLAAELTTGAAEGDSLAASANSVADRLQEYRKQIDAQ
jgi:FtsZ-binding cell division protein ZapB